MRRGNCPLRMATLLYCERGACGPLWRLLLLLVDLLQRIEHAA